MALDSEVLLLDDLGAHRVTDWVQDTVTAIVTHRCNNQMPLIATTNLPDADVEGSRTIQRGTAGIEYRRTLRDHIGDRARSRLFEMCNVIQMPHIDDYRVREANGFEAVRRAAYCSWSPPIGRMPPTICRRSSSPTTFIRERSGSANWSGSRISACRPSSSPSRRTFTRRSPANSISRAAPVRAATWSASSACCENSTCAPGCGRCRRLPGWSTTRLDAAQQRAWLKQLEQVLATQTASPRRAHRLRGRPRMAIDAAAPPPGHHYLPATETGAFARSREAIIRPAGRCCGPTWKMPLSRRVGPPTPPPCCARARWGYRGDERPTTAALRRDAALLRGWARLFADLHHVSMPKPAAGKLPEGVIAVELVSPAASAVSITNTSHKPFHDDLRVVEPLSRKTLVIPGVSVAPGQALWLPVSVSLGPDGLCRDCTNFAPTEHIVYATAELLSIEFENGILAMEFAAPEAGEVILQLARRPTGPFLAAGKPTEFDWDEPHMRARLRVPAGQPAGQPRAHRHCHRSPGHLGLFQRPASPGDRTQEHDFHHVLLSRGRRALPPASAGRLHGDTGPEIAQRDRLRSCHPRRRNTRRFRQPCP